jgi:predicted transcriptional regulator
MAKATKLELEESSPMVDEEDAETLAAIDEGIRDAEAGQTVPAKEVRKLLRQWTIDSFTRKGR